MSKSKDIYFCPSCGQETMVIGPKRDEGKPPCDKCTEWYEDDTQSLWSSILDGEF